MITSENPVSGLGGLQPHSVRAVAPSFPLVCPELHIRLHDRGPQSHGVLHAGPQPAAGHEQVSEPVRPARRTTPEPDERGRAEVRAPPAGPAKLEFQLSGLLQRARLQVSRTRDINITFFFSFFCYLFVCLFVCYLSRLCLFRPPSIVCVSALFYTYRRPSEPRYFVRNRSLTLTMEPNRGSAIIKIDKVPFKVVMSTIRSKSINAKISASKNIV